MNKLIGAFLLVAGMLFLSSSSEAAGAARGAKAYTAVNYTATVSTITIGPAALYAVLLSSGASPTEYLTVFDASSTVTPNTLTATNHTFKLKVWYTSSSANTSYYLDPPLQFTNGIIVAPQAATGAATLIWERGRVTQGY